MRELIYKLAIMIAWPIITVVALGLMLLVFVAVWFYLPFGKVSLKKKCSGEYEIGIYGEEHDTDEHEQGWM